MGYLVPTDAPNPNRDSSGFLASAMAMQQIDVFARQIQSKHALFPFDGCFSGSVFAAQFIRALAGDGDTNGDGDLTATATQTATELGEFLQDTVVNCTRNAQTPQYGKIRDPRLDRGDIVFPLPGGAARRA